MVGELFLIMSFSTQYTEEWDPLLHSKLGYFGPSPEEDSAHETHLA